MLEGKELEGKIGTVGAYSLDVKPTGEVEVMVGAKINIISLLEEMAKKTQTTMDDQAIAWIKGMLALLPAGK